MPGRSSSSSVSYSVTAVSVCSVCSDTVSISQNSSSSVSYFMVCSSTILLCEPVCLDTHPPPSKLGHIKVGLSWSGGDISCFAAFLVISHGSANCTVAARVGGYSPPSGRAWLAAAVVFINLNSSTLLLSISSCTSSSLLLSQASSSFLFPQASYKVGTLLFHNAGHCLGFC